jgi:hypothetical protein
MHGLKQVSLDSQRGVSLSGLIFVLAVVAVIAMFSLKVIPTFIEFRAIKSSIATAKAAGGSVRDMQLVFDKNADINAVSTLRGRDLIFTKNGESTDIAFEYEKRIPLLDNVALVIDYSGTTDPRGVIPEKVEQPK